MSAAAIAHPLELAFMDVLDALEVQAPGWLDVRVRRLPGGQSLRVAQIEVQSASSGVEALPPALGVDPQWRRELLTAALDRVHDRFYERNVIWDGLTIQIQRDEATDDAPTRFALTTVQGDPIVKASLARPDELRIATHALAALAAAHAGDIAERQRRLEEVLRGTPHWELDEVHGLVRFATGPEASLTGPAEPIGTWRHSDGRWGWSWGDADQPEGRIARACRASAARYGMGAFRRSSYRAERELARCIAGLAAEAAGAITLEQDGDGFTRKVAVWGLVGEVGAA